MKKTVVLSLYALAGAAVGAGIVNKVEMKQLRNIESYSDKHLKLFLLMNQWVKIKQKGKNLESYFKKNGYKRIAVYGMSYVDETLVEELKNSDIIIAYGIDQKAESIYPDVEVVFADDKLEEVDAVVVTAITFLMKLWKSSLQR